MKKQRALCISTASAEIHNRFDDIFPLGEIRYVCFANAICYKSPLTPQCISNALHTSTAEGGYRKYPKGIYIEGLLQNVFLQQSLFQLLQQMLL